MMPKNTDYTKTNLHTSRSLGLPPDGEFLGGDALRGGEAAQVEVEEYESAFVEMGAVPCSISTFTFI